MILAQAVHQAAEKLSAAGINTARLDAELLLAHILGKNRTWLFTHSHEALDRAAADEFRQLIERRSRREPLQYIIGTQEFWGLEFLVTPDVLIPRPETELLVESSIAFLKNAKGKTIIDLCTGSGCVAISLARTFRTARIFATDCSAPALAVARENARKHEVTGLIRLLKGDLFRPLEELDLRGSADLITANPPYIETADLSSLQPEVRDFEPEMALISGPEGTELHSRIISSAPSFLKPDGALIMEMGIGQAGTLMARADATDAYAKPEIVKDLAGIERIIILKRKQ